MVGVRPALRKSLFRLALCTSKTGVVDKNVLQSFYDTSAPSVTHSSRVYVRETLFRVWCQRQFWWLRHLNVLFFALWGLGLSKDNNWATFEPVKNTILRLERQIKFKILE